MFNWFFTASAKAIDDADNFVIGFLVVLFLLVLLVVFAGIGFWLFTWAVATLFHYTIDFTWINYWAFFVLSLLFGRGSSSSSK